MGWCGTLFIEFTNVSFRTRVRPLVRGEEMREEGSQFIYVCVQQRIIMCVQIERAEGSTHVGFDVLKTFHMRTSFDKSAKKQHITQKSQQSGQKFSQEANGYYIH